MSFGKYSETAHKYHLSRRSCLRQLFTLGLLSHLSEAPAKNFSSSVLEVESGVFVHKGAHELFSPHNKGDVSNLGFIVGKESVAIIDTGGSPIIGQNLKEAISTVTKVPISYVINTHMHPDHVFGNVVFKDQTTVFVGHSKLARGLAARAEHYLKINKELLGSSAFDGTQIVYPSLEVSDVMVLDLGGRQLELKAHQTAHTDNDLTITDKSTGITFMGDLIFSQHIPTLDGSVKGWISVLEKFSKTPPHRIIPGHGPALLSWSDAAQPMIDYLTIIADEVRAYIRDGKTLSDAMDRVGISEEKKWELFDAYHKRNVSAAFAELEWEQ